MKIAVVSNTPFARILRRLGPLTSERCAPSLIEDIGDCLVDLGHTVILAEGDRHLIDTLEGFFGTHDHAPESALVFNYAFGVQGRLRYTHVPAMLEMLGIPYLGSNPLAHGVASDKTVAKALFRYHGLPTPDFVVRRHDITEPLPFDYPVIVKPIGEAVSLGLFFATDQRQLRDAIRDIWVRFHQPALVEDYVAGREINVSLIGNDPVTALTPVEVVIEGSGPSIYTYLDKHGRSSRSTRLACPARLPSDVDGRVRDLAIRAFHALGCEDWARVDLRMDDRGRLHLLEINTIPSLGRRGSFRTAAHDLGWELKDVVARLVDVAVARYRTLAPSPLEAAS